jgi:predicted nuclease of predicted toxin-antitoxin system
VKLLLDEQISGKVAERLRKKGVDAIAVTEEPTLRGLSDPDVFDAAQTQRRTVVTYNRRDFELIVRSCVADQRTHHGLVIVHPTRFPNSDFARLTQALATQRLPPGGDFLVWLRS